MEHEIKNIEQQGPEEPEKPKREPYTRPAIHSSDAFETFSLASCGLLAGQCLGGVNP